MTGCPTELELERFVEGVCPEDERSRIETHRGECMACSSWLLAAQEDEALVPSLRRAHTTNSGPRLTLSPADAARELDEDLAEEPALARYKIVRRLGAGGMGVVYEAEQRNPQRSVALKVLPGSFVSDRSLRMFGREAQVLGRLSHPSIARILEAGTYASHGELRPFFAMELVDGLPLTEYAQRVDLRLRQRLELLATVCDAVQHAHQMGVVHRDLKPANVLVTADGTPKVLDFGVARIFDDEAGGTVQTQVAEVVGTLPYISPEQLSGDPLEVDTRTDVYALGVMLFELLAGRSPFEVATRSVAEAIKLVEQQQPIPLGSLDARLSGDLEVIANKALAKEKDQRYESAAALADDLRRFLRFEPIAARPPSTVYYLRRFARRNRAIVAVLGLAFLALGGGLATTTWQARRALAAENAANDQAQRALVAEAEAKEHARRAEQAEAEARAEARTVEEANAFLHALIGFDSNDPDGVTRTGDTTLSELMKSAGARLDRRPFSDPEAEATLRIAVGNAQRRFGSADLAIETLQHALELREQHWGPDHVVIAETLNTLGVALSEGGLVEEGLAAWERALEIYAANGNPEPEMEATTRGNLARILLARGRMDDAELLLEESLAVHTELLGPDSLHVMNDLANLAFLRRQQGRRAESLQLLREALEVARRAGKVGHRHTLSTMGNLAISLIELGYEDEGLAVFRERCEGAEKMLGADPETARAHHELARVANMAALQEEALEHATRAVEILEQTNSTSRYPFALQTLGHVQTALGRTEAGEANLLHALELFESGVPPIGTEHIACRVDLGALWMARGELERSRQILAEAVELLGAEAWRGDPLPARAYDRLARVLDLLEGGSPEAERLHRAAVQASVNLRLPRDAFWVVAANSGCAAFLARRGAYAEAEPLISRACAVAAEHEVGTLELADALRETRLEVLVGLGAFERVEQLAIEALSVAGAEDRSARHLALWGALATALREQGKTEEALSCARAVLELAGEVHGADSETAAGARAFVGLVLTDSGALEEAAAEFDRAHAVLGGAPLETARRALLRAAHGRCLVELGRQVEAEPLLLEAVEAIGERLPDAHPAVRCTLDWTARLYETWGRPDAAAPYRARL